jgi:hypothetical protein
VFQKGRKDQASCAVTKFNSEFNALHRGCKAQLFVESENLTRDELQERGSDAAESLQKMRDLLAANVAALPAFDAGKANKTIDECDAALVAFKAKHLPKKSFGFRSTVVAPGASVGDEQQQQQQSSSTSANVDPLSRTVVADRENCLIVLRQTDVNNDVTLKNLTDCRVWIDAKISALRCDSLRNCRVMCGNVTGSMWAKRSDNCTFVGTAQQVRVGESHGSLFQMRTKSRICIEQSDTLRFAALCEVDGCESAQFTTSDDDNDNDNDVWNQVQDFDWIKPTTASPNWSVVGADADGVLARASLTDF